MKKWGVRLIGFYFLIGAIFDLLGLVMGTRSKKGFLGLIITNSHANQVDIMGWIGVFVLAYAGYYLLRLDARGRLWTLIVLWPWVIISGFYLAWIVLSPTSTFFSNANMSMGWHFFYTDWPGEINGPYRIYSLFIGIFLFYSALTYFLMRKDVKQLFQKADTTAENHPNPEAPNP